MAVEYYFATLQSMFEKRAMIPVPGDDKTEGRLYSDMGDLEEIDDDDLDESIYTSEEDAVQQFTKIYRSFVGLVKITTKKELWLRFKHICREERARISQN